VLGRKASLTMVIGWGAVAVVTLPNCNIIVDLVEVDLPNLAEPWVGCYSGPPRGTTLNLEAPEGDVDVLTGTLIVPQNDEVYGLSGNVIQGDEETLASLKGSLAGRPDLTSTIVLLRSDEDTVTVQIDEAQFLGPLARPCP
jgi:hypothetical protein